MEALERQSRNKEDGEIDLALLTDGLRAEREQGITIDVAYKYFSTPRRKFIIADAPGHIQYTRNMVTGASNANLIVILIDARNGIVEQTRRHSIIASLLNIPHVVVAINKMDLVDYSQDRYNDIVIDYAEIAQTLQLKDVVYLPISALKGDNIVDRSTNLPWYEGPALLELLEKTELQKDIDLPRPPAVQYVIRPQTEDLHDYRGYAGKITSGTWRKGDIVTVLPAGLTSRIREHLHRRPGSRRCICTAKRDPAVGRRHRYQPGRPACERRTPAAARTGIRGAGLLDGHQTPERRVTNTCFSWAAGPSEVLIRDIEYRLDVNTLEKEALTRSGGPERYRQGNDSAQPLPCPSTPIPTCRPTAERSSSTKPAMSPSAPACYNNMKLIANHIQPYREKSFSSAPAPAIPNC